MALHDLGRMEEFEARFGRFRDEVNGEEGVARIYAWIGDNERAFEWLDKMVAAHGPEMLRVVNTHLYQKIKSDSRWRALRDKHGYHDKLIEDVDFSYALPTAASID